MGNSTNKNIDCLFCGIRQATEKYVKSRKKLVADIQAFLERWEDETQEELHCRDLLRIFICSDWDYFHYYITRGEKGIKRVDNEDYNYGIFKHSQDVDLNILDFAILAKIWELLPVVTEEYRKKIEEKKDKIEQVGA